MSELPRHSVARLETLLRFIQAHDEAKNYEQRNRCVYRAIGHASECGYGVGFRIDPDEPEWPVAYIELPTGQVSWHLPQHDAEWDGHTTEQKYQRVQAWLENQQS